MSAGASAVKAFFEQFACAECGEPTHDGDRVGIPRPGGTKYWHRECLAKQEQRSAEEQRKRDVANALRRLEGNFYDCLYARDTEGWGEPTLNPPQMPFARFGNAEFRRRASQKILAAYEAYAGDRPLFVSGPTGSGKTAGEVAHYSRAYEQAQAQVRAGGNPDRLDFAFATASEIVVARRNSKLGSEARLIELAKERHLLYLDECTTEPLSEVLFEVLDARYRKGFPTVVTTGLRVSEWRARYGDAAFRRIAEPGAVVEAW